MSQLIAPTSIDVAERAVGLLRGLVDITSYSETEAEAVAYLVSEMESLGYSSHIDAAGNAVGIRRQPNAAGQTPFQIVLLGHIDTVPGNRGARIENGILYGRGSVDAKGPLATFVMAGSRAALPAGVELIVIGAVEEESASSKGARYVATAYQPDLCIIGEPSGWDGVTLGYKGRLLLDYTCHQPMSHTAQFGSGVGEAAIAWWNSLIDHISQFNRDKTKLFEQLIPSLRDINTSSDGLTNTAIAKVGVRLPPDFDCATLITYAEQMASGATVSAHSIEPAFQSNPRSSLASSFRVALRRHGAKPRVKLKTGTSDMNVVGPIWNCPIVAYGPGDSQLDHTPDEHLVLAEYQAAISILRHVLENVDAA